jgi:hypothetical protein
MDYSGMGESAQFGQRLPVHAAGEQIDNPGESGVERVVLITFVDIVDVMLSLRGL